MTTRCVRTIGFVLVPWIAASSLMADPIGRPTPHPCAAEGACVPHRATYGYTKTKWRPWPGTPADVTETGEPGAIGAGIIDPTAPPDPRTEDKLAPPKVDALEPAEEGPAPDDVGIELPNRDVFNGGDGDEPAGQGPAMPERPRPPFLDRPPFEGPDNGGAPAPGQPPGQPPIERPTLPFGLIPAANAPQVAGGSPSEQNVSQADLPPRLPQTMRSASPLEDTRLDAPSFVLPAAAHTTGASNERKHISRIPTEVTNPPGAIQQQSYQHNSTSYADDTPPQLPAGLFNRR